MEKTDHTFIVGDVHGCFDECLQLLKKAKVDLNHHRLIFIGDLINKGPHSLKMLEWIEQHKTEQVIGNHELKFIRLIEEKADLPASLLPLKERADHWVQFIKSWPHFIEEEDFLVIHAGVLPGFHPKDCALSDIVNIRYWNNEKKERSSSSDKNSKPWHDYYTGKKLIIYGHWARQGLLKKKNSIGLDSGCVYGHKLSGLCLPSRKIIQVPSLQP